MATAPPPPQVGTYQASDLAELQGDVSETAMKYSLTLIPTIASESENDIHDNACGSGAVSETIVNLLTSQTNSTNTTQTNPARPTKTAIWATDINQDFVSACTKLAEDKKWGDIVEFETGVMSAQDLKFENESFTHSFTSFAFHCLGDHEKAAKEVYRTLKPGGVAVISIWTFMPHVDALQQHAHFRTRGTSGPMPALLPLEGYGKEDLKSTLEKGGFGDVTLTEKECFLKIRDLRSWAVLAWRYLGGLSTGWYEEDEGRWDVVIQDIVEQLEGGEGIAKNEKGETVLKMRACVAVAKK